MQELIALLLAAELLSAALAGGVWESQTLPPPAPAQAEVVGEEIYALLGHIHEEYDPAAAGSVGAIRWADKLLRAYLAAGTEVEAARSAAGLFAASHDGESMVPKLERLRWGAEVLLSGTNLGLFNEPGSRPPQISQEKAEELFDALADGLGIREEP